MALRKDHSAILWGRGKPPQIFRDVVSVAVTKFGVAALTPDRSSSDGQTGGFPEIRGLQVALSIINHPFGGTPIYEQPQPQLMFVF